MTSTDVKQEVAYFMRRLYTQQLTTTSGGNISCRLPNGNIAITPSGKDKARLQGEDIGEVDLEGRSIQDDLKLSIETGMHLAIYKARPDISAIVHAHPTIATCFTAMNKPINTSLTAEARALLGVPAFAPYALMGTENLAEIVAKKAKEANVILMENHGILAVGKKLLTAFDRLELIEAAAKMTYVSLALKSQSPLTDERRDEIDQQFGILF